MNLREAYRNKALYLMEAPDEETTEPLDKIEIYFDNMDEETQKLIITAIRDSVKVAEDDQYGNRKIAESLAKKPMFTVIVEELVRLMNIEV